MPTDTNLYEELSISRDMSLEEISRELSQLERVWHQRETTQPEKAHKMLALIDSARTVFSSKQSKDEYDRSLERLILYQAYTGLEIRRKRILKTSLIVAVSIVIVIIAVSVISSSISKKKAADEAQIAEAINEAQDFADDRDYEKALEIVEDALKTHRKSNVLEEKKSEYTEALDAQKAVQAEVDAIINQAQALADKEDFEGALEVIQTGIKTYSDSNDLKEKANEYDEIIFNQNKTEVLAKAEELSKNGDYVSAVNLIKDIQGKRKDDQDCNAAINLYTNTYVDEIIDQVDTLINEGNFTSAKSVLDSAMAALPDNSILVGKNQLLSEIISHSTAMLTELTSITGEPASTERLTDNYGNSYSSAIINNGNYRGGEGPIAFGYLLDGKYRTFSGVLYIPEGEKSDGSSFLTIIADGIIVYASPEMTKTSAPEIFCVNITGCNELIIEWSNNAMHSYISDLNCCIAEASVDMSAERLPEDAITNDEKIQTGAVMMKNLTSIASNPEITDRLIDINGNRHGYAIINNGNYRGEGPVDFEFLLDGEYKRFTGVLYIPKDEKSDGISTLTIIADGVIIYVSPEMNKKSSAITVDLDISGCNDFVVEWSNNARHSYISDLDCCLADAYFIP